MDGEREFEQRGERVRERARQAGIDEGDARARIEEIDELRVQARDRANAPLGEAGRHPHHPAHTHERAQRTHEHAAETHRRAAEMHERRDGPHSPEARRHREGMERERGKAAEEGRRAEVAWRTEEPIG